MTEADDAPPRTYDQVLAAAVAVLTEAARLTRPVLERDEAASEAAGHWVGRETGRREPGDWAEFVTLALAGAAANIGGIEAALAGRPGSWEADGVRRLLTGTVGEDEALLLEHRTEPLVISLDVDEILQDGGAWEPYLKAQDELVRRYEAIGIPTAQGVPGDPALEQALAQLEPGTDEQWRQADALTELEDRLDQQQLDEWAQYAEALRASVEAAALRLPGLTVPVVVNVAGDEPPWTVISELVEVAITTTPKPGEGQPPPLERLILDKAPPGGREPDFVDGNNRPGS